MKPSAPVKTRADGTALESKPHHQSAKPEDDAATNIAMQELHLTARQQMQLWDHVKKIENFWMTLPELEPGIIARIAKSARERRWEVIFLTTRPSTAGDLVQLQSQRGSKRTAFSIQACSSCSDRAARSPMRFSSTRSSTTDRRIVSTSPSNRRPK